MAKKPPKTENSLPRSLFLELSLFVVAAGTLTALLAYMRPVLVPFVIAVFLFYALAPLVDFFRGRFHLGTWTSLLLVGLLTAAGLAAVTALATSSIHGFVEQSEAYRVRLLALLEKALALAQQFGLPADPAEIKDALEGLPLFNWARSFTGGAVSLLTNSLLVGVFLFFLLGSKRRVSKEGSLASRVNEAVSRYLQVKILASLAIGLLTFGCLWALDVELAALFGILAFFLNFVPALGPALAILIPLPVVAMQFGPGLKLVLATVLLGLTQGLIGNVLETRAMGAKLGLHPAVVLLALLFWGMIWGLPGMFLAVPLTSAVRVALSKHPRTLPMARALEGEFD